MKYGSWPKHLFLFAVFDNHCKAEHTDLSTVIRVQYNNASRGRLTTAGQLCTKVYFFNGRSCRTHWHKEVVIDLRWQTSSRDSLRCMFDTFLFSAPYSPNHTAVTVSSMAQQALHSGTTYSTRDHIYPSNPPAIKSLEAEGKVVFFKELHQYSVVDNYFQYTLFRHFSMLFDRCFGRVIIISFH